MLRELMSWLTDYKDHSDLRAKAAGTIALVVAGNQPFYPLYLYAIVGTASWPAWFTLLTFPLFAAVPAVAKRNSLAGRAMLPIVGVANTVLTVKLIGVNTAVELFLFPCVLLATILFRWPERLVMLGVLAMPFAAYLLIDGAVGAPLQIYSDDNYRSIIAMHAISVASLLALMGYLFASILSEQNA